MAEETLSQAAIDALLAGHVPQEKPKAAAPPPPPPPPPEPKPAPKPEKVSTPPPKAREEPAPVVSTAPAPSLAAVPAEELKSLEEAIAALSKRVERLESLAGRMESIERSVKSASPSKGPDADLVKRVEALEGSVITICQIQQEAKKDPSLQKIAQMQQQLAKVTSAVQALSSQIQALSGQVQKTTSQSKSIVRKLGSTMGYNIQNTFECQQCGAHGYVVSLVKCSACGHEDWWGWWPPEETEEEMDEFDGGDEYAGWETAEHETGGW